MEMRWAFDLGTNSIGWAIFRLDADGNPSAGVRAGVRIFSDGRNAKSRESLAVDRRLARQMRRSRDRRLRRQRLVIDRLVAHGLLPEDPEQRRSLERLDPYELRRRGLSEELSAREIGRAIYHLSKRRGFKSNRKTDPGDDDASILKARIAEVREELTTSGFRTIGEWLAARKAAGLGTRARLHGSIRADRGYDLYVDRAMVHDEFEILWHSQRPFHPELLDDVAHDALEEAIFFQRKLRPVDPGRCTLEVDERRAPIALPSAQMFRIYQEVNNLRIRGLDGLLRPLRLGERDRLVAELCVKDKVTFAGVRRVLKLPRSAQINLEGAKRDELKGNRTAKLLGHESTLGAYWGSLTLAEQDELVSHILGSEDEDKLVQWLVEQAGVTEDQALATARTVLPAGYYRLSELAISKVLSKLQEDVVTYDKAVAAAGYASHSRLGHTEATGEVFDQLPYYGEILQRHTAFGDPQAATPEGRFGRVANPTVHIALGQLRLVVNELVREYGRPSEVVIEVTRDLRVSERERREIEKLQAKRQDENDRRRTAVAQALSVDPEGVSRADVEKFALWEDLGDPASRVCPYSGKVIALSDLFSPNTEVDHILPWSRTLDNSRSNKTVCFTKANRDKAGRSPFEAFGQSPDGYDYQEMLDRATALLPSNKAWRFAPDAMDRFTGERDFLARALNDTAYISRLAREYLQALVGPNGVWAVSGRITGLIRSQWQLSRLLHPESDVKVRDDHRHHAVDAIVLGTVDRRAVKAFADHNARERAAQGGRILAMEEPFPTFRLHAERMISEITVSHRPDHSFERKMADDSRYGLRPNGRVAIRRPLGHFKSVDDLEAIVDERIREACIHAVGDSKGAEFTERLGGVWDKFGMRRVRTEKTLEVSKIALPEGQEHRRPSSAKRDGGDDSYVGVKGNANFCIEIVDEGEKWSGSVVTTEQAYGVARREGDRRLHDPKTSLDGRPLVMRLMINDIVEIEEEGRRKLVRVKKISRSGNITLVPVGSATDAGVFSKTANSLRAVDGRLVHVSPAGRLVRLTQRQR